MKNLLISILFLISYTVSAQVISVTITKELDTLTLTKVPKNKVIKVGKISYVDSTIKYDTTISTVKKYVPTTTPPTTGTTVNFTFTQIPITDPDIISPGRGAEQWHNSTERIPNPTEAQPIGIENSLDVYYRIQWSEMESGLTAGNYTWGRLDNIFIDAINKGQRVSFGIMTVHAGNGTVTYDGAPSSYPQYLHNLMKLEATNSRDWVGGGGWIPNYNSPNYISRLRALHQATEDHLLATTYTPTTGPNAGKTVRFSDVVYVIDIRGYGNYGEWHSGGYCDWNTYPAGRQPTVASLKAIIDAHTQIFDKWPLAIMIAAFDGGGTYIPLFVPYPEVAHYAATARNAWGQVGWRKDQYGATDGYLATLLENNNVTWNGSPQLKTILMNTWKTAPITGEPPSWTVNGPDLMRQVTTYHTTSFGNGNYGPYPDATLRNQIRDAFKKAGYRLVLTSGKAVTSTGNLSINLAWQNIGIAPTYENWNVVYELVNSSNVVAWSGTSTFKPKFFQPGTTPTTVVENFPVSVPTGTYTLRVAIKDPTNYRANGVLAITGRTTNGYYNLGTITY